MTIAEKLWALVLKHMPTDALLRLRDLAAKRDRGEPVEQSAVDVLLAAGDASDCQSCGHAAALQGSRGACLVPLCQTCTGYRRSTTLCPI